MSGLTDARRKAEAEGRVPLPRMRTPSDNRKRVRVIVTVKGETDARQAAGSTWGGAQQGRYAQGKENVVGYCERCCRMVRAWQLEDRQLPFGRGEIRVCKGGC